MSCCYPVPSPEMVSTLSLAVQKIALVLLQWRDQSEKRFAHMELELQQLKGRHNLFNGDHRTIKICILEALLNKTALPQAPEQPINREQQRITPVAGKPAHNSVVNEKALTGTFENVII